MRSRRLTINWPHCLKALPADVPQIYQVEANGLPDADSMTAAMTGATGREVRRFVAHLLHGTVGYINDLEAQVKMLGEALDKAAAPTRAPGDPDFEQGCDPNKALQLIRKAMNDFGHTPRGAEIKPETLAVQVADALQAAEAAKRADRARRDEEAQALKLYSAFVLTALPGAKHLAGESDLKKATYLKSVTERVREALAAGVTPTPYEPPVLKDLGDAQAEMGKLIDASNTLANVRAIVNTQGYGDLQDHGQLLDVLRTSLPLKGTVAELHNELQAAKRAQIGTDYSEAGPAYKGLVAELEHSQAELKRANTKAGVYYTSWKALERRSKGKPALLDPSDEMRLAAAAVTALVDKGYIWNVMPGGSIPTNVMCSMVTGVIEGLPAKEMVRQEEAPGALVPPATFVPRPEAPAEPTLLTWTDGTLFQILSKDVTNSYLTLKVKMTPAGEAPRVVTLVDYMELKQVCDDRQALRQQLTVVQDALDLMGPLAQDRKDEIFFRTDDGTSYGCDNMSIGEDRLVSSMAIKVRRPDGTEVRIGFIPVDKANELVERIDERRRQAENWQETAAQHARNEEFYRDLLDQIAGALVDPEVFRSDDGSVQQEPIRLKLPALVAELKAQNLKLYNTPATMLRFPHRDSHFLLQSFEVENGTPKEIRGLYYDEASNETTALTLMDPKHLPDLNYLNLPMGEGQFYLSGYETVEGCLTRMSGRLVKGPHNLPVELRAIEPQAEPTIVEAAIHSLLEQLNAKPGAVPSSPDTRVTVESRIDMGWQQVGQKDYHTVLTQVLSVPRRINAEVHEHGGLLAQSNYHVETNTLMLMAAWNGEHPALWDHAASFEMRPQITCSWPTGKEASETL